MLRSSDRSDFSQNSFFSKHSGARKPWVPQPFLDTVFVSASRKAANPKSPEKWVDDEVGSLANRKSSKSVRNNCYFGVATV